MRLPGIGGRRYAVGASVAVSIGSAWTVWGARWIPSVRISHPYPSVRFDAIHPRSEPYALCGLQNYVVSSGEPQWNQDVGGSERHIRPALQRTEERHQRRLVAPMPFRCVRIGDLALGQSPGFHLQVDLCIDVGGVNRNMPEPGPNRVDVHAGTEKVGGGRVANGVGADPFSFQGGYFGLGPADISFDQRVDAETGDGKTAAIEKTRAEGERPAMTTVSFSNGVRPQRTTALFAAFTADLH